MGTYVVNSKKEQQELLTRCGLNSFVDLYKDIPEEVLLKDGLNLPKGLAELEVKRKFEDLADKNKVYKHIFRGAGAYNHYIPSVVKAIASKEEFVTAYTPYQAEISQGILQAIFEFQTMICELTGMQIGTIYAGNAIFSMVLQPFYGYLSDKIGMKRYLLFFIVILVALTGPFFVFVYEPLLINNFLKQEILIKKEATPKKF